jgi:uncharacterized protein (TIGR02646 family)
MRAIVKGVEPPSLAAHRSSVAADYDNFAGKDVLRSSLVNEQRGLCCYCLARIRPTSVGMKIEHWRSQTRYPSEQLVYSNLLGACKGNEGGLARDQHCDTRKRDQDFSRNPANHTHRVEDLMCFGVDGRVFSNDPAFDGELNEVLNLNVAILINNRKAVLTAFKDSLPASGNLPRSKLEKWLRDWNGDAGSGELQPFCQVIVYWLRKRLARY